MGQLQHQLKEQQQQRAQQQLPSSYVPKDIFLQLRIRSVQFHSTAMGQLQHQLKEQQQQRAQQQLPSSYVPKDIFLQLRIRSVRVLRSIHDLVLRSNHHNTARGQHLGQQQQ